MHVNMCLTFGKNCGELLIQVDEPGLARGEISAAVKQVISNQSVRNQ